MPQKKTKPIKTKKVEGVRFICTILYQVYPLLCFMSFILNFLHSYQTNYITSKKKEIYILSSSVINVLPIKTLYFLLSFFYSISFWKFIYFYLPSFYSSPSSSSSSHSLLDSPSFHSSTKWNKNWFLRHHDFSHGSRTK